MIILFIARVLGTKVFEAKNIPGVTKQNKENDLAIVDSPSSFTALKKIKSKLLKLPMYNMEYKIIFICNHNLLNS